MQGLIIVFAVLFGFIGYAIGKPKGHGGLGAVLGALLGLIGLVIIGVMKPAALSDASLDASLRAP